jgi:PBSX family phage terminase large subunit
MKCHQCHVGDLEPPKDGHPSHEICNNCGSIVITYQPLDYQEQIHTIPYKLNAEGMIQPQIIATFGGYGSGKSKASLSEFFIRAMENPGGTGLITAPTLQLLKRTTIKTLINEIIPPPLIENYNKTEQEITLVNGFIIYAIPSDDDEKLRSINAGLVHIEEASAIKRSIYDQLLTRLRDPFVKNRAVFVCSNPELTWIKDVLVDNHKRKDPQHPEHEDYNPYIYCHIWETALNKKLPPDFIAMNSRGKPEWWVKKYLMGSFEATEGAVYPRFMSRVIDPFPVKEKVTDEYGIPLHWERIMSMDHGLRNPTMVPYAAIDPNRGVVVIYNEYYKANTLVPEHSKNIKTELDKIPAGKIRFMMADPSIKNKTDPINGKSVLGLYAEQGIYWTPGNNDIEAGILRVNAYIEQEKVEIYSTCVNLIREHLHYKFPEITMDDDKNLDERPEKKNEHSCDAVRYMFMNLPADPLELTNLAYEPKLGYNRAIKGENEYGYDPEEDDRDEERDWTEY